MCLLHTGPSITVRKQLLETAGLIDSIYKKNSDGLGVMYATTEGVKSIKKLPANVEEARAVIERMPTDERPVAVHWRMKTHGHIDLENCHPYKVSAGVLMMHNGVLATGNKDDYTKSDTWHFAKNYLSQFTPDQLHDPYFQHMLGNFIGSNRFAIMSADGRLSVVNSQQGWEHEGVWYSNTYAINKQLLVPYVAPKYTPGSYTGGTNTGKGAGSSYGGETDSRSWADSYLNGYVGDGYGGLMDTSQRQLLSHDEAARNSAARTILAEAIRAADEADGVVDSAQYKADMHEELRRKVDGCLYDFDATTLAVLMEDNFDDVWDIIQKDYKLSLWSKYKAENNDNMTVHSVNYWIGNNRDAARVVKYDVLTSALMNCLDWEYKEALAGGSTFATWAEQAAASEFLTEQPGDVALTEQQLADEMRVLREERAEREATPSLTLVQ